MAGELLTVYLDLADWGHPTDRLFRFVAKAAKRTACDVNQNESLARIGDTQAVYREHFIQPDSSWPASLSLTNL